MEYLLNSVGYYVAELFKQWTKPDLVYHNFNHTFTVVARTYEIARHYRLTKEDELVVEVAAWFHDTGHLFNESKEHEKASIKIMRDFLEQEQISVDFIDRVHECIIATKFPSHPISLLQQIICDADTYHLGTIDFFEIDELVREELRLRENIMVNDWNNFTLKFLQTHEFYTLYCRKKLNPGKSLNVARLKKDLTQ